MSNFFLAFIPILDLLKTPENKKMLVLSRDIKWEQWPEIGFNCIFTKCVPEQLHYSQDQFRAGDFNFLSDSLKIILLILDLPMFKYNYYSFTPSINSA